MGSWHPFGFWMIFGSLLFWLAGGTECLMISLLWNIVLPGILHDARVNKAISVIALAAILGDLENYEVFKTQRTLKVVVGESKRFFKIWKRLTPPLALVHVLYSFTPLQKLCIYCACVCIYNCIYIYILCRGVEIIHFNLYQKRLPTFQVALLFQSYCFRSHPPMKHRGADALACTSRIRKRPHGACLVAPHDAACFCRKAIVVSRCVSCREKGRSCYYLPVVWR